MLTCHFQLKMKSKTECHFSMYRFSAKMNYLPLPSTLNLLLVEFIHILTDDKKSCTYKFCNVLTCFRVCSSCTKLHTELVCLKRVFLENGYPENFINKCFKRFMDNLHVVEETTLTV